MQYKEGDSYCRLDKKFIKKINYDRNHLKIVFVIVFILFIASGLLIISLSYLN
jgi:hypothetical protein